MSLRLAWVSSRVGTNLGTRCWAIEAPKKAAGVILDLHLPIQIFRFRVGRFGGGKRFFGVDSATAVFHALADLALVNIQPDVIPRFHGGSLLGVSESAGAEFSFSTPSAPPSTHTFNLTSG